MKKLLLLFVGLALCLLPTEAKDISPAQAKMIASKYVKIGAKQNARQFRAFSATSSQTPDYYAFNDTEGKGFVLIAGDDRVTPVLGYSHTGQFDDTNLPPTLKAWLDAVAADIETLRKSNQPEAQSSATNNDDTPSVIVAPLIKTTWAQQAPYYNQTPTIDGQQSVTGCVATAMAQIMKYYQWPATGTGSVKYDTPKYDSKTMEIDFSKSTYDWANMLDRYTTSPDGVPQWNDTQAQAVSTLMRDLGAAIHMQYSPDGSGAYSPDIANTAILHFSYNATYYEKSDYTTKEWLEIIKQNLNAQSPLLYNGNDIDKSVGHQFIIDGYDSNNYLHVNWGWNGTANGYYTFANLGAKSYLFNNNMGMSLLTPNKSGKPAAEVQIPTNPIFLMFEGHDLTNKIEAEKDNFSATINMSIQKVSYQSFIGDARFILKDEQGNVVKTLEEHSPFSTGIFPRIDFNIKPEMLTDLEDGTYQMIAETKDTRSDGKRFEEWIKCSASQQFILAIHNGTVTLTSQSKDNAPLIVKDFQLNQAEVEFGQSLSWTISLETTTEEDAIRQPLTLMWKDINDPQAIPVPNGEVTISAFAHSENILECKSLVTADGLKEGKYEVSLSEQHNGDYIPMTLPTGPFYVTVINNPEHIAKAYVSDAKAEIDYVKIAEDGSQEQSTVPCTISKDNMIDISVTDQLVSLILSFDIKWIKPDVELAPYQSEFELTSEETAMKLYSYIYLLYPNYEDYTNMFTLYVSDLADDDYDKTIEWNLSYATPNESSDMKKQALDKDGNPFKIKTRFTKGGTGIRDITTQDSPKVYFDLQGNRHSSPVKGLNIVHTGNGETKKIMRK